MERFGRYELLRRLGQGGMAEVFLARLASGDAAKYLAIKRLLPTFSQKPRVVRRLANEARLTVWLTHPNIVQVFDFGRIDGLYFIAMEFVDGCDLRSVIRPGGRQEPGTQLPLEVALDVAVQLCDALRYAHRCTDGEGQPLGIIHRDISPHNVLVSRDGHPKLADFGVARAAISDDLSRPGAVLGKLSYMPPEQAKGLPYDARVDIYACGAVLYEMLCGVRPFAESNRLTATVERHPDPPSKLRPSIPRGLDELVLRAMSPRADERFPDAAALGDAVEAQLGALGGRPKPHQLAGLVREALNVATPKRRPAFVASATRVERPVPPSRPAAEAPDESPVSVERREYDPGEDSLIEPEVTAVRSFLGTRTSTNRGQGADWYQPRERVDTVRSTGLESPTQRRDLSAPAPVEAAPASIPEAVAEETTGIDEEPAGEAASSLPISDMRELPDPLEQPTVRRPALPEEVLERALGWVRPRRIYLAAGAGGLLLFLLGLAVGRCTASSVVERPRIVQVSGRAYAPESPAAKTPPPRERVAKVIPAAPDAAVAKDSTPSPAKRRVVDRLLPRARKPRPSAGDIADAILVRRRAIRAFMAGRYRSAMRDGQRYLRLRPKNQSILAIVGASACKLRDRRVARRAYLQLGRARRAMLRRVCMASNLDL